MRTASNLHGKNAVLVLRTALSTRRAARNARVRRTASLVRAAGPVLAASSRLLSRCRPFVKSAAGLCYRYNNTSFTLIPILVAVLAYVLRLLPFFAPRMSLSQPLIIVGGGLAGLSCAHRALELGATSIVLLDKESKWVALCSRTSLS